MTVRDTWQLFRWARDVHRKIDAWEVGRRVAEAQYGAASHQATWADRRLRQLDAEFALALSMLFTNRFGRLLGRFA